MKSVRGTYKFRGLKQFFYRLILHDSLKVFLSAASKKGLKGLK